MLRGLIAGVVAVACAQVATAATVFFDESDWLAAVAALDVRHLSLEPGLDIPAEGARIVGDEVTLVFGNNWTRRDGWDEQTTATGWMNQGWPSDTATFSSPIHAFAATINVNANDAPDTGLIVTLGGSVHLPEGPDGSMTYFIGWIDNDRAIRTVRFGVDNEVAYEVSNVRYVFAPPDMEVAPTPAALAAGLPALGLLTLRRRREQE